MEVKSTDGGRNCSFVYCPPCHDYELLYSMMARGTKEIPLNSISFNYGLNAASLNTLLALISGKLLIVAFISLG